MNLLLSPAMEPPQSGFCLSLSDQRLVSPLLLILTFDCSALLPRMYLFFTHSMNDTKG